MNPVLMAAFGWLVPGGAHLLMRRYVQFAVFALVVLAAFAAGLALQGGVQWPTPDELAGADSLSVFVFRASSAAKMLAGGPYLIARLFDGSGSFLDTRLHEYGSTLLVMAGLFNLFAVSSAFDLKKEKAK
jgi:hypothetical protein